MPLLDGLVVSTLLVLGAPPATDPELASGLKLATQGDYGAAILVLDSAARRLGASDKTKPEAVQAYLHLGIAYVAEAQQNQAIASFREALKRDPALTLSADDVSPRVRESFQRAKNGMGVSAGATVGTTSLLLVAAPLAAGAAVFLSSSGGEEGAQPSVLLTLATPGTQIAGVPVNLEATVVADCSSPRVSWAFGDGSTGSSAGNATSHTYAAAGAYEAVADVQCASGRSTTARTTVTVRSLSGTWQVERGAERLTMRLVQAGASLSGDVAGSVASGTIRGQRSADLSAACGGTLTGATIDSGAREISGTGSFPCGREPAFVRLVFQAAN